MVKEDGDYKMNSMDPDLPLKWEQIEEIVSFSINKVKSAIQFIYFIFTNWIGITQL